MQYLVMSAGHIRRYGRKSRNTSVRQNICMLYVSLPKEDGFDNVLIDEWAEETKVHMALDHELFGMRNWYVAPTTR